MAASEINIIPADKYLLKAKNRNTRGRYEIISKLTVKRLERGVSIVDF